MGITAENVARECNIFIAEDCIPINSWDSLKFLVSFIKYLYYYLLVIKAAYLDEPEEELPALAVGTPVKLLAGALVTFMVAAGFFPNNLIELFDAAVLALR